MLSCCARRYFIMAKHHKLELSETERQELIELRDKGEPAYLRNALLPFSKYKRVFRLTKSQKKDFLDNATLTLSTLGCADTEQKVFKDCSINLVVDANLLMPPNHPKKLRRRSTIPSDRAPNRSIHIKRAGHFTRLAPSCRGSGMFRCRVSIKYSVVLASAINAPEHTCGALIQTTPKKSPGSSKFWKRPVNIHRPLLRFTKMSSRFIATPP